MQIKLLLLISGLMFSVLISAQKINRCATTVKWDELIRNKPEIELERSRTENVMQKWIAKKDRNTDEEVITIPVVVHVLYYDDTENISDAQIYSQIDVLNADFRGANEDTTDVPYDFKSFIADTKIQFCLAGTDPDGNPTTGITRTETTVQDIGNTNRYYSTNLGGHNIWDRDSYLNIWVCAIGNGLLGYAYYPGAPAAYDGAVIDYQYFGTTGTATYPYNLGRTATHEIGHWLNLIHIWGDANCGDDLVDDTPEQESYNFSCPSYPSYSNCTGNGDRGDMYMNYMDYTDDVCMHMFSYGQYERLHAAINTGRSGLITSNGCDGSTYFPTAINQAENVDNLVEIFPNPVNETLTARLRLYGNSDLEIAIFNNIGKRLLNFNNQSSNDLLNINISDFPEGIYFLTLTNEETNLSKKFVVSR